VIVPYTHLFAIRETSEISKNRDCPGILRRYRYHLLVLLFYWNPKRAYFSGQQTILCLLGDGITVYSQGMSRRDFYLKQATQ
jgi:hypothetical protein